MARHRRWLRPLLWTLGILALLLVTLALAVPLVLRGPALARFVNWMTAGRICGTVQVGGGRLGAGLVLNVLLGRATPLELDDVWVADAAGAEILRARRAAASLRIGLGPWRLDLHDLRVSQARLAVIERGGPRRAGLASVFRPLPASGREGCFRGAPRPRSRTVTPGQAQAPPRPRSPAAMPVPVEIQVHGATLDNIDLLLDFPLWSLALDGVSARGELELANRSATKDQEPGARSFFRFALTGAEAARGGKLRVGSPRNPYAAMVPFDRVKVTRFSSGDDVGPDDLVLEVESATTGRAVLAGRARFTDVMVMGSRVRPPGLDLDARWTRVGDGLRELERQWRVPGRYRGRAEGNVTAVLKGPFTALGGKLLWDGNRVDLDLALSPERRVDAAIRFDDVDTAAVLDRSLAPLFGGRLAGEIRAHAQLAAPVARMSAVIDQVRLRLDRARSGPWPSRWRVRMGASGLSDPEGAAPAADGSPRELVLVLTGARIEQGTLFLDGVRAGMDGAEVRIAGKAAVLDENGEPLRQPRVDAKVEAQGVDLARLLPALPLRGRLGFTASLRGPSGALVMNARLPVGSTVRAWGQPFVLPTQVEARVVEGDRLVVPLLRVVHPAGGTIEAGGSVTFDGPIDAQVAINHYPLAHLPAVERLGVVVEGRVDSGLTVTGSALAPRLAGQVAFTDVRVGGVPLGGGALSIAPDARGATVEGRVVDGVGVRGRMNLGIAPSLAATVTVRELPLGPLLARAAPGLAGKLSADAELEVGASGNFQLDATVTSLDASYEVARQGLKIALRNDGPGRVRATERGVALVEPMRLRGPGVEVVAEGQVDPARVDGQVRARVALAPLRSMLGSWLKETSGMVEVVLGARGPRSAPERTAEIKVVDPLRIWPASLLVPLTVPSGVVTLVDERRLEAKAVTVALGGLELRVDGGVAVDQEDWRQTALDLAITGQFDPAVLARRLPQLLVEGHGRAKMAGRLTGTLGTPQVHGHADLQSLGGTLKGSAIDVQAINGRLELNGQTLTTTNLTVALSPRGQLHVGGSAPTPPRTAARATPPARPATNAPLTAKPPVMSIARIELPTAERPTLGSLSVPIAGRDIGGRVAVGGVQLNDLDVDLSLAHEPGGPLRVTGEVWVQSASFAPTEARVPSGLLAPLRRGGARAARRLHLPEVFLDIGVHARRGALDVRVPYLPDFAVAFDCRLTGSPRSPRLTGQARGESLYSRLALFLFDTIKDHNVRGCGARPAKRR